MRPCFPTRREPSALIVQGVAVKERPVSIQDIGRSVPHPWAVDLPRARDGRQLPPQDHFRGEPILMRRLLSLDFVLDHLDVP